MDLNPLGWLRGWGKPKLSGRDDAETKAAYARHNIDRRGSVEAALALPTAWACIRLLSETAGTLPLPLYRRVGPGERALAYDHPLYALLHDSPNAWQTAAEYWEGNVAHLCGWGNAFSEKKQIGDRLVALEPLRPDTGVSRNSNGDLRYTLNDRGKIEVLPAEKVFHLRGFGMGGDTGLSPVRHGWRALRGAIAAQDAAIQFLEGGLQIAGFAKEGAETKSTPEQRAELMQLFAEFMGSPASGKVMPLPKGWDYDPLTMNPEDAQLLETRAFDVEQVCRLYRVPPFMVGHSNGNSNWGTGLEQQTLGFLTFAERPYLVRIEQAIKKQLLRPEERQTYYAEFVLEGLMRADSAGRAALYASGTQNGWMTRREIRRRENLPDMPGDEVLTVQSNLVPLDKLGHPGSGGGADQVRSALGNLLFGDDPQTFITNAVEAALKSIAGRSTDSQHQLPPPKGE